MALGEFCFARSVTAKGGEVYCTRPPGHDGEHIATVGPYLPFLPVLRRWARRQRKRAVPTGARELPES